MSNASKSKAIKTVDDYLALQPEKERASLEKIRRIIKSAAPQAEETLNYQTPAYKYKGLLVGFAAAKNHVGFYVMSETVMQAFSSELNEYAPAKTSMRFSFGQDLPASLIKKIVQMRMKENDEKMKP